jgi:sodium-coupled monocarboxylate transporter 8/12
LFRPDATEKQQFRLAHWLTLGYGALVLALAYVVGAFGSLIEGPVRVFGVLGGPLLGLFLLGMLVRRANSKGAVTGWAVGTLVGLLLAVLTKASFLWLPFSGATITFFAGCAFSLLWPPKDEAALANLTLATLEQRED